MPGSGAMSATGRQLESFLGHMDLQVNPFESAGQVYREMRGFLRDQAKETAQKMKAEVKQAVEDVVTDDKQSTEQEADKH